MNISKKYDIIFKVFLVAGILVSFVLYYLGSKGGENAAVYSRIAFFVMVTDGLYCNIVGIAKKHIAKYIKKHNTNEKGFLQ